MNKEQLSDLRCTVNYNEKFKGAMLPFEIISAYDRKIKSKDLKEIVFAYTIYALKGTIPNEEIFSKNDMKSCLFSELKRFHDKVSKKYLQEKPMKKNVGIIQENSGKVLEAF